MVFPSILNLSSVNSLPFRNHIRLELQSSKSTAQISVLKLLDIEKQPPFSQRGDFGEEQEKWMRTYWSHFFPHESDRWYRTKDEIHVMATVRTYFKFAFEVRLFLKCHLPMPDVDNNINRDLRIPCF